MGGGAEPRPRARWPAPHHSAVREFFLGLPPNIDPATILQFDRVQPSTKLNPIDFPQFTSIDSIDNWTVARVGVRNRLQTRRDDLTVSWLELETFFDVNFDNPFDQARITRTSSTSSALRRCPWATLGNRLADSALRQGLHRNEHERQLQADRESAAHLRPSLPELKSVLPQQQPLHCRRLLSDQRQLGRWRPGTI